MTADDVFVVLLAAALAITLIGAVVLLWLAHHDKP